MRHYNNQGNRVERGFGGRRTEDAAARARPPSTRSFLLGFAVVALLCLVAAYAAFETQRRMVESGAKHALADIAVLKAGQVDYWRRERHADGMALSGHTALGDAFERWLARGAADDDARERLARRLETLRRSHEDFMSLLFLDTKGHLRIGAPDRQETDAAERQLALKAMATGQTLLGEIALDAVHRKPVLGMAAPLLAGDGERTRIVGATYVRIDPARFISMVEAWPLDSKTAETLLVRRDGDRVLYLNHLRHIDAAPLTFSAPLAERDLPAAQALRGATGIDSGRDYRGQRVIRYVQRIPDSDWTLVAKIDEAEIYAPIRELGWYVSLGLFAALGFAAYVFWTLRSRAELAYRGYRTQLQNRMLMQRLESVARSASDIIVLTDESGRVVEVNDKALEAFGYTRAEMLGLMAADLRAPECQAALEDQRRGIRANGSAAFETVYRRKDGSCFSADVSGHLVSAGNEVFVQAIIRDATERKRREIALRLHERMTHNMQEGLSIARDEDGVLIYANPRAEAMFGYQPGDLVGRHVSCLNPADEDDPNRMAVRIFAALREFGAWSGEIRNARKDGGTLWCKTTVSGLDHPDHGKVWLSIHTDITALKNLESAQHDSLLRIRKLGRHLVSVQETERRKLGAELHDRTSANLAAAKLLLRDVAALMPEFMGSKLSREMEDAQALIDDTDATIRDISGSLRPPLLDFLGLTATLQSLAGKFEKRTGMKIDVRNDHVPRLDSDAETLLYRIVQEALSNCARHARARHVDVGLAMSGDNVVLTVVDDGVGFDAGIASRGETLGLMIMRERAEFADGTLRVESTLGGGTAIRVVMPCAAGSAEPRPPPRLAVRSVRSGR